MKKKIFISIILMLLLVLSMNNIYAVDDMAKEFFESKTPEEWYEFYEEIFDENNRGIDSPKFQTTYEQADIIIKVSDWTYAFPENEEWFLDYLGDYAEKINVGNIDICDGRWLAENTTAWDLSYNEEKGENENSNGYKGTSFYDADKVQEILESKTGTEWLNITKQIKEKVDNQVNGIIEIGEQYDLVYKAATCLGEEENKLPFEEYLTESGITESDKKDYIFVVLDSDYVTENLTKELEYQLCSYGEGYQVKELLESRTATQWLELTKEIKTKVDNNTEEEKVKVAQSTYDLLVNAAKCLENNTNRTLFNTYLTQDTSKSQRDNIIFHVLSVSYIQENLEVGISAPGDKDDRNPTLSDIVGGADGFLNKGTSDTIGETELQNMSNLIYNILLTLGIIIAVVVGGFLGIKFMTSGLEGKVEVKEMLIPYVVGCVILFGAFTIWKIVLTFLQ